MNLSQIIQAAREFLREEVTSVSAQNIADTFESYGAGAPPTDPWVNTGGTPPKIASVSGNYMLSLVGNGFSGTVGVDISSQIASDSNPITITFGVYRTVDSATTVVVMGINNAPSLNSTDAVALLKVGDENPGHFWYNTSDGYKDSLLLCVPTSYSYKVTILLYPTTYTLTISNLSTGAILFSQSSIAYPSGLNQFTFGYIYFPATNHASDTLYVNDLTSTGVPTVYGEVHWTNPELSRFANEGQRFFRQTLPDRCFEKYIEEDAQNMTSGTADYDLPDDLQRFIAATLNGYHLNVMSLQKSLKIRKYLSVSVGGGGGWTVAGSLHYPMAWMSGGQLHIFPTPTSTVSNGLVIYYLPPVNDMDINNPETATPELPEDLHDLIVLYVIMKAREKYHEDTNSVRGDMEALALAASAKYIRERGTPQYEQGNQ